MNKVDLGAFTVTNIYPCPNCDSDKYAHFKDDWNFYSMGCDNCDYNSGYYNQISHTLVKGTKEFKEFTRILFNNWNRTVSEKENLPMKKVRIYDSKNNL